MPFSSTTPRKYMAKHKNLQLYQGAVCMFASRNVSGSSRLNHMDIEHYHWQSYRRCVYVFEIAVLYCASTDQCYRNQLIHALWLNGYSTRPQ